MKPTLKDVEYSPILSKLAVAYQNEEYVAERILPVIESKKLTGKYFKYGKDKFRKVQSLRAMGTSAKEIGHKVELSSAYNIKDHALKEIVPDELVDQSPDPLTPSMDATENVVEKLLIEKEYDLASYITNTSNMTSTTLSGGDQWDDYVNSDPIGDVDTAKTTIHGKIFRDPNVMLVGKQVHDKIKNHPDIIDRIKYTKLGVATEDLMAEIFGVEKYIVGKAGYNSATEGQTASMSYIWGKHALLLYVTDKPRIKSVSFGYHFQKEKPRYVERWYDKDREGTWVRVHDKYTREYVDTDCGYLIDAVIS